MLRPLFAAALAAAGPAPAHSALIDDAAGAASVAACGFSDVRARYDGTLQEEVVDVTVGSDLDETKPRCAVAASIATNY